MTCRYGRTALLVALACAWGTPVFTQPTATQREQERIERLRQHEERVKEILAERERQRAAGPKACLADADSPTSGALVGAVPGMATRRLHHEVYLATIMERRVEEMLAHAESGQAYRADTAARRTRFEAKVTSDPAMLTMAREAAMAQGTPKSGPAASPEQLLDEAVARVFRRDDHLLAGRAHTPLAGKRVTLALEGADAPEVEQALADQGVALRLEGAAQQTRLNLVGRNMTVAVVLLSIADQAKATAWRLDDNSTLVTDGEPPPGATRITGVGDLLGGIPEFTDVSLEGDAAAEFSQLCAFLYVRYLMLAKAPPLPLVAPTAPPVDP